MKKMSKISIAIISALSIIIVVLVALLGVANAKEKKLVKISKDKVYVKKDNTKEFTTKLDENENIVFFGDSITEIYPLEEIYGKYQIVNSGVSGYETETLLDNMDSMLYQYNPTKVFLLIGTNDIAHDVSDEVQKETFDNIKKICNEIKQNRPNAKIYVESVYPVNREMKNDMVGDRTNEAIKKINSNIENFCKKSKITYINMYDELTDKDGNFDEKFTYDGLHPSTLGYAKITKVLTPYVYE